MPLMFGFAQERRKLLEAELLRVAAELPALGVERAYLTGDLALERVGPDSELELVLVHRTVEAFHRRPDFFVDHLRPRVGMRLLVYTPQEFEELSETDPVLQRAQQLGSLIYAG